MKDELQPWLLASINDPISQTLLKNSQLTRTQLETLLIDILAENLSGKQLKYDEKAKLRLTKAQITRGSFNRTAKQAKENVVKSVYTILLLGYLGIFESTVLDPYLAIANKLRDYAEACKGVRNSDNQSEEDLKTIELVRKQLENSLKELSDPSESGL